MRAKPHTLNLIFLQRGLVLNKIPSLRRGSNGFTLIELLVVIGILAILLSIVLIAINPARQFAQANNTQRRSDVTALLNALHQYAADNSGNLPTGVPVAGTSLSISTSGTTQTFCDALVPTYIASLPKDPSNGVFVDCTNYDTHYSISVATASSGSTPRITINADNPQLGTVITVTR